MKNGLTEIVCIIDNSGSMYNIANDTIGGINHFLSEQKKLDGDANVTITLFNNNCEVICDNKNINIIPELNETNYKTGGGTALNDAIGMSIINIGQRLSETSESERPEKVIVAILTDGEENSSYEHTTSDIKSMIEHQEDKYNWQFMFLAANQDAFQTGRDFGMKSHNSINFNATAKGAKNAFDNMTLYSAQVRSAPCLSKDTMMSYVAVSEDK